MSTERFIKATEPVKVELNGKQHLVKPLSFKNYIAIQRDLRNSFADNLTLDEKETAYIAAIEKLATALNLPVDEVLDTDNEFITKLVDVFLLQTK
jgi:hypothetical protein